MALRKRNIEAVDVNGATKYRVESDTQPQLYNSPEQAGRRVQHLDAQAKENDRPLGSR